MSPIGHRLAPPEQKLQSRVPAMVTAPADPAFLAAVTSGLQRPVKAIPPRFFYDLEGSHLFDQITRLPEYYPTRTETALLRRHAEDLAAAVGTGRPVIEFGAGSATKTPLLLDALATQTYVPIDISGDYLEQAVAQLGQARPGLRIVPVVGDFTTPLALPPLSGPVTGFFPGSTIGNFDPAEAIGLLRSFRQLLGEGGRLVIGIDTRKDRRVLEAAYDDAAGVTAAFNRNLLTRINRELAGTIPVEHFAHRAIWNEAEGRVEMHLEALRDLRFTVAGEAFAMAGGETIHTESCYKYTPAEADRLARAGGWEPLVCWTDPEDLFGLHVWGAVPDARLP